MTAEIKKLKSPADPWSELDRVLDETRNQFYRTFGLQPFGSVFAPFEGTSTGPLFRAPRLDVADTGKAFRIVAEIPGIPKDHLDIHVRGTTVEIRGEQAKETEEKSKEYVHRERSYAGFYRSLEMPEPVVATQAKAKVENGVLELELPKVTPTPSSRDVKISVA